MKVLTYKEQKEETTKAIFNDIKTLGDAIQYLDHVIRQELPQREIVKAARKIADMIRKPSLARMEGGEMLTIEGNEWEVTEVNEATISVVGGGEIMELTAEDFNQMVTDIN